MQKIQLGLRANWKQFTILLIVNAFVGAMIGVERTIFPRFEMRFLELLQPQPFFLLSRHLD